MKIVNLKLQKLGCYSISNNCVSNNDNSNNIGSYHKIRIYCKIIFNRDEAPVDAIIDTGAVFTIIPLDIYNLLDQNIALLDLGQLAKRESEKFQKVRGVNQGEASCDFGVIGLTIEGEDGFQDSIRLPAKLSCEDNEPPRIMLGFFGFLDRHKLMIDPVNEYAYLEVNDL